MSLKVNGSAGGTSSGTTVSSEYLEDSQTTVIDTPFSFLNVVEGKSFRARIGGTCGTEDDWYMVIHTPSYAVTGKIYVAHKICLFCRDGSGQVKLRTGVSSDYDTNEGEAVTSINQNGILNPTSEITVHRYIGTEATGLPSDLGYATMFCEVGNFGLCENDVEDISKDNPLILQGDQVYIIQASNEYFQDQRITIDVCWWELDGSYFSDEFLASAT